MSPTPDLAAPPAPAEAEAAERVIRHLASFPRPSASDGERRAAEWIAAELREAGLEPRIEEAKVVGGYWWPWALLNLAGLVAARLGARGKRKRATLLGALAAALLWDDIDHRERWFRRFALPKRTAWNVHAEAGDPDAPLTVLVVSHHDAAHTGAVFDPRGMELFHARFPDVHARATKWPSIVRLVVAGPMLAALGSLLNSRRLRRLGSFLCAGSIAAMIDIGRSPSVPGANDNLSGVACVLGLARRLRENPVPGVRVVLLSTGSEESNSEGMQEWGRRHFPDLPTDRTVVLCVDGVGSPELHAVECEGMLVEHHYDAELKDLAVRCAEDIDVTIHRGLRFAFATDGQIAIHNGYRTMTLGSVTELKVPVNYHWPTDDPDHVSYDVVADAIALTDAMVRELARL